MFGLHAFILISSSYFLDFFGIFTRVLSTVCTYCSFTVDYIVCFYFESPYWGHMALSV